MLGRFVKDNFWYVITFLVALSVMLISLYIFFGIRAVHATRAQNSARADTLSTAIVALPSISSVVPAKTSGEADYVLTSRSHLAEQIEAEYTPQYAFVLFGLIPTFYATDSQQARHATILNDALDSLTNTTDDLTHLKKLIEYMPMVDLGGSFAEDVGRSERLGRTKRGIDEALKYIQLSGLPHEAELITRLTKLNAQTLALTDQTKAAWSTELLEVQTILVNDIEAQDIQQSGIVKQLQAIRQSY